MSHDKSPGHVYDLERDSPLTESSSSPDPVSQPSTHTGAEEIENAQPNIDSQLGFRCRNTSGCQNVAEIICDDVVSTKLAKHYTPY